MRVTIKDIAIATGFSTATVSKVLNDKAGHISQNTKDCIREKSKELGYRPNQLAVGLVKKRTRNIGLLVPDICNPFFALLAKGAADECRRNDWNVFLCNTSDDHTIALESIQALADNGTDGIIYNMPVDTDLEKAEVACESMRKMQIPFVMCDRYYSTIQCPTVVVAHEIGGYLAAKHLLELGHTKIGCVTGPSYLEDSQQRLDGYKRALQETGIPYVPERIFEGRYSANSGYQFLEQLLQQGCSAIFAFNDLTALGVYNRAQELRLEVGKNFSLVGYDDTPVARNLGPPLTTIRQPAYDVGRQAVLSLFNEQEKSLLSNHQTVLEPALIVRKSTSKNQSVATN